MATITAPFLNCLDLTQPTAEPCADDAFSYVSTQPRDSHRRLQVVVMNKTPYKIKAEGSYFHLGEYHHAPTDIAPYDQMTFSSRSSARVGSGIAGGVAFRAYTTTDERWLYSVVFRIGWSCPDLGSPKVGVVAGGGPAKEAYDVATEGNQEARTDCGVAVCRNQDGTWKYMNLKITAIRRGWEPVYVVEHFFENRD